MSRFCIFLSFLLIADCAPIRHSGRPAPPRRALKAPAPELPKQYKAHASFAPAKEMQGERAAFRPPAENTFKKSAESADPLTESLSFSPARQRPRAAPAQAKPPEPANEGFSKSLEIEDSDLNKKALALIAIGTAITGAFAFMANRNSGPRPSSPAAQASVSPAASYSASPLTAALSGKSAVSHIHTTPAASSSPVADRYHNRSAAHFESVSNSVISRGNCGLESAVAPIKAAHTNCKLKSDPKACFEKWLEQNPGYKFEQTEGNLDDLDRRLRLAFPECAPILELKHVKPCSQNQKIVAINLYVSIGLSDKPQKEHLGWANCILRKKSNIEDHEAEGCEDDDDCAIVRGFTKFGNMKVSGWVPVTADYAKSHYHGRGFSTSGFNNDLGCDQRGNCGSEAVAVIEEPWMHIHDVNCRRYKAVCENSRCISKPRLIDLAKITKDRVAPCLSESGEYSTDTEAADAAYTALQACLKDSIPFEAGHAELCADKFKMTDCFEKQGIKIEAANLSSLQNKCKEHGDLEALFPELFEGVDAVSEAAPADSAPTGGTGGRE